MVDNNSRAFSPADAANFARRLGFAKLTEADMPALAAAMTTILAAGEDVPRMRSKFDAPAAIFTVAAETPKRR